VPKIVVSPVMELLELECELEELEELEWELLAVTSLLDELLEDE